MRCKTCHYSLEGLAEHRCPECGREFDPRDPDTFDREMMAWRQAWWRFVLVFAGAYAIAFFGLDLIIRATTPTFDRRTGHAVFAAAVLVLLISPLLVLLALKLKMKRS